MEKELDICKHCAEYGSEFCEECLKEHEQKTKKETVDTEKDINYK